LTMTTKIEKAAEILIPNETGNIWTSQTITSGGLWGIESDSSASYLKEIEDQELEDLKTQLKALGIKYPKNKEVIRE
jgi:hypothetical protein